MRSKCVKKAKFWFTWRTKNVLSTCKKKNSVDWFNSKTKVIDSILKSNFLQQLPRLPSSMALCINNKKTREIKNKKQKQKTPKNSLTMKT